MGSSGSNVLFNEADMFSAIEAQLRIALKEVARFEPNQLLNTPTDDIVSYIVSKYSVDVPAIDRSEAVLEQPQETALPMNDFGRRIRARATVYTLVVPFSGDPQMFRVRPSTFDTAPPMAQVLGNNLFITVTSTSQSETEVKREFIQTLDDIDRYLSWQRDSCEQFNRQLRDQIRSATDNRKAGLLKDRNIAAGLGFKMRVRADRASYSVPQVRRKIDPKPPSASTEPYKPEPALDEANYQHILKVLENMTHVMERSPAAFSRMDEESIRQHFLVQLNGHFEGQATGETFNYSGKTDILLRVEGRNIFIAECKFWRGEKSFAQAIDQILAYLSWRDTKAAIVLFNRNKGFSEVLEKVRLAAEGHPNRKRGPKKESETRLRYVFGNPSDSSREIIVTVLAFEVPGGDL